LALVSIFALIPFLERALASPALAFSLASFSAFFCALRSAFSFSRAFSALA
jgi:hypothetical protein